MIIVNSISDNDKVFYYNSGFQDGYHKAMDKIREFVFDAYTVPDKFLKSITDIINGSEESCQ